MVSNMFFLISCIENIILTFSFGSKIKTICIFNTLVLFCTWCVINISLSNNVMYKSFVLRDLGNLIFNEIAYISP